MATGKKSFILYCDLIQEVDHLTDEEKGKLFQHLLEYVNDMNPVMDDRVILGSWKHIQRQLKRDLEKYEGIKEKRSEAGKKSAELRQQKAANPTSVESVEHPSTNPTVNDTVTVTVNDTDNDILLEKETKEIVQFDVFWNLYDKKEGRASVEYKWQRITPKDQKLIIEHLPKYVGATPDKKYRKLAMTYLSQKTWLDEELPNQGKSKPFETPEDAKAGELMRAIKKQAAHEILYPNKTNDQNQIGQ